MSLIIETKQYSHFSLTFSKLRAHDEGIRKKGFSIEVSCAKTKLWTDILSAELKFLFLRSKSLVIGINQNTSNFSSFWTFRILR